MKGFACSRVVCDPSAVFAAHELDGTLSGAANGSPTAPPVIAPSVNG